MPRNAQLLAGVLASQRGDGAPTQRPTPVIYAGNRAYNVDLCTPGEKRQVVRGKDLTAARHVVATGGDLTQVPVGAEILRGALGAGIRRSIRGLDAPSRPVAARLRMWEARRARRRPPRRHHPELQPAEPPGAQPGGADDGHRTQDPFGESVEYFDRGCRLRAGCDIGRQDTHVDGILPLDEGITVIGTSSDHLILDVEDARRPVRPVRLGGAVAFAPDHAALLASSTSPYVEKIVRHG